MASKSVLGAKDIAKISKKQQNKKTHNTLKQFLLD